MAETIPVLARSEAKILRHCDYYDYPRSGEVDWRGKRYWFQETDVDEVFRLLDLSDEQWQYQDERTAAFNEHVGEYEVYVDGRRRQDRSKLKPIDEWSKYYQDERWKIGRRETFADRPVVAMWDWRESARG